MGIVFMIVTGAVLGWLATIVFNANGTSRGLQTNIAGGIIGALVAGLIISPAIGTGSLIGSRYSVGAVIVSMIGAMLLLLSLNLLRSRILR